MYIIMVEDEVREGPKAQVTNKIYYLRQDHKELKDAEDVFFY
jgi:hypothetical protein